VRFFQNWAQYLLIIPVQEMTDEQTLTSLILKDEKYMDYSLLHIKKRHQVVTNRIVIPISILNQDDLGEMNTFSVSVCKMTRKLYMYIGHRVYRNNNHSSNGFRKINLSP
jgi:hypothetical protein